MASNPMQRKVRNSFLLGILVMLVIVILIGAIVFFAVIKPKMDKEKEEEAITYTKVYQLKTNVKSGEEITLSMLETIEMAIDTVPTNAIKSLNGDSATIAKVDLAKGTILASSLIAEDEQELNNSLRYVEYNMITIPTTLDIGDYIDIRLKLPNSQDLIVVSRKQIETLYGQTVGLNLTEEEILLLNSAIVEAYIMSASELYMAKYVEPGLQTAAILTYSPTAEVTDLIYKNENIVTTAKNYLIEKYNTSGIRNWVNAAKGEYAEDAKYNLEAGMQEQIEAARKAREDYLSELEGI